MNSSLLISTGQPLRFGVSVLIALLFFSSTVLAQESVVTGTIRSDETGEGIPGVNIVIKGTSTGTITDVNGNFSLRARTDAVLVISSIGFLAQEIPLQGRAAIEARLSGDVRQLDEVVVVGYGSLERKDLIGSVTKVNPLETKGIQAGSFDAQLQGKVSGVQISSNTGVPGEAVTIRVRGATSINADNDPLYVIDGVFVNSNSLQTISTGGKATSPIADINPADIESIEVLKDAEATALYGARGANGVVLVTTRRGDFNQRTKISFNASTGWSKAAKLWDLATGPEHATLVNEFYRNAYADAEAAGNAANMTKYKYVPFRAPTDNPAASPAPLGLPEDQKTYDRLHELFRTAKLQNYDLSLTGGNKNTRYYVAGGFSRQEAIIKPIYFERASFKVNLDQHVNEKVLVGVSNTFTRTYRNQARAGDGPQGGLLQAALHTPTYLSPYNEQGQPVGRAGFDNLTLLINNYDVNSTSLRYIGNIFADVELLPSLKFRSSWGVDYNNYDESEYWNTFLLLGASGGLATSSITQYTSWLNEQTLTYSPSLGESHALKVLFGNTLQSDVSARTYAEGRGFANNSFTQISSASTSTSQQTWTRNTLASFFAKVAYGYADKYLFDASVRADGSSRFGKDNRWGYFPAVGAAWRIKQEDFLSDVDVISNLKLRVSYGITGNQNGIGNFASRGLWSGASGYQGSPGTAPLQLANNNLKWERTSQISAGIDAGFWDNRVTAEVNVYRKYTTDGLLQITVPATTGFANFWENSTEISNKGFELELKSVNVRRGDLEWTTTVNVARNINKIEKLKTPSKYGSRDLILLKQGSPLYSFWVYKQLYVDPQTGNAVYEDVKADGKLTTDDRQIYGSVWPKYFGGITNTVNYRSFDLSVFFAFQYGNKVYNHNRFFGEGGGAREGARVIFKSNLERWQKPGDITDVPRPDGVNVNNYIDGGSRWLEDGSFLRLRSLTLGYTLPKQLTARLGIQNLRVYASGTNLLLFTKYTGLDPESSSSSDQNQPGIDLGTPPQPRSLQLGVNVGL